MRKVFSSLLASFVAVISMLMTVVKVVKMLVLVTDFRGGWPQDG